ncbi:phosphoglycerate mutase family [Pyrrhoderma noxium]|uniref:Phosphoglycerate mutase family n=1 Tax=Pyrrhoderma noxium TaxID=2282107 RepID=A0A286UMS2_9AGAM|nr:phosphoglycerate mutase family [Pyrrhoderma noxium]
MRYLIYFRVNYSHLHSTSWVGSKVTLPNTNTTSRFTNTGDSEEHKAKLSHEIIGGAAAYEAAKAYEEHIAREGKPDSHAKAKEILAGFAGAFIDREFETRGLDFIDKERAKHDAHKRLEEQVANDY